MYAVVEMLDVVLTLLRTTLFGAAAVAAVVCAVDWGVRTRRISPFSGIARFFRTNVDPLIAPVERRIVRAGGLPSSAPWWALAALVVGGIVIITLLEFIRSQFVMAALAVTGGSGGLFRLLVSWTVGILQVALFVRVVSSWVQISPYSKWIRWAVTLTEWFLAPLRQVLPTVGPIDLSPMAAYFILSLLGGFLMRLV